MKKIASIFAIVLTLVICLGALTACSGTAEETKKPTTSTSGDKNESKPTETKPTTTQPSESKPTESKPVETQPEADKNEGSTESKPADGAKIG